MIALLGILFLLLLSVLLVYLINKFKGFREQFNKQRELFVEYLEEKNDLKTLRKIGEYNSMNVKERWYPSFQSMVRYLETYISENNDGMYKKYLSILKKYKTNSLKYLIPIAIVIYSILEIIIYICEKIF